MIFNTDPANPLDHLWVDRDYAGESFGSELMPYKDLSSGLLNLVPSPNKTKAIHLETGSYAFGSTLDTPLWIVAEGGTVTITP